MSLLTLSYDNVFDFLHGVVVVYPQVEVIGSYSNPVLFGYKDSRSDRMLVDLEGLDDRLRVSTILLEFHS